MSMRVYYLMIWDACINVQVLGRHCVWSVKLNLSCWEGEDLDQYMLGIAVKTFVQLVQDLVLDAVIVNIPE